MTKLFSLPESERPREKMVRCGPTCLADHELIALILGSGTPGSDVFSIARQVVEVVDARNTGVTLGDLKFIEGLGPAKSAKIVAALEFSRRRIAADGVRIREPRDVVPLISHLADRKQETFICISLNGAHEVIASRIVTVGLANVCQVHPREVFADAITDRACSVIVAHNHPSGDLTPSGEDLQVTTRLKDAAQLLGIKFLDHIIFSRRGIYSIERGG